MNASRAVERVRVAGGEGRVASHVGTHLLGELAGRLGLISALGEAMASTLERRPGQHRGRLLTQVALMLAAGGRCVSDLAVLRNQPTLFGAVASDATVWRVLHSIDEQALLRLRVARGQVTASVVERAEADDLVLDVDATLVEIHSEHKQQAAAHFKGGFGFHPLLVFCEPLGLPLAGRLRPGNANANNAADQLGVIDEAIAALPVDWRAGHHEGDDESQVRHRLLVRADGAGYSKKVVGGLAARNLSFSVGMPASEAFTAEIRQLRNDDWQPALTSDGRPRKGAQVAELDLIPAWAPAGTRVIVRRERAHPGAQLRLWDHGGWRHQAILINQTDADIAVIEARHRAHANVENRIKAAKDSGLDRLPFTAFAANTAWLESVLVACLLLTAVRVLLLDGELAIAEPRRLRYTLLHTGARIIRGARRTILRLPEGWPWAPQLLAAYQRLGP